MADLLPSLLLSLRIALCATVLVAAVAIPLGFLMARRWFVGRSLLEALFTLPLVLPPTVLGYYLLTAFGRRGIVGVWLDQWLGFTFQFHWTGAVLAAATVAFPLLYLPARAAFGGVSPEMEAVARLNGATLLQVFWHVSLPIARKGIAAGLLLTFSRALGEFGATIMILGDMSGKQTLPILIYTENSSGARNSPLAMAAVVLLSGLSLGLILLYNRATSKGD